MKNIFIFALSLLALDAVAQNSQFRIRQDEYMMIGPETYKVLTFGQSNTPTNNGQYAIEYWPTMYGLNIWKPWPAYNWGNAVMFLRDDHRVGIGTTGDWSYRLDVNGPLRAHSGFWTGSDKRLKKDIKPYAKGLEAVLAMQVVSYHYSKAFNKYPANHDWSSETEAKRNSLKNETEIPFPDQAQIGLLAQELEGIVPEAVMKDSQGMYSINYSMLVPVLIDAVQSQQKELDYLKKKVELLEKGK